LSTRIRSTEFITSERALSERFEGNQKYEHEIAASYEIQKHAFLRETVSVIKSLCPGDMTHLGDSPSDQIKCIVSNCQMELDTWRSKVRKYETAITQSLAKFQPFSRIHLIVELPENSDIREVRTSVLEKNNALHWELEQSLSDSDSSVNELIFFLRRHLADQVDNINEWTAMQLKQELDHIMSASSHELLRTKDELQLLQKSRAAYETIITDFLINIRGELADSVGLTIDVIQNSFECLSHGITDLVARSRHEFQSYSGFREFLTSFLSELLNACRLPEVELKNIPLLEMKNVMVAILDSPLIQERLGTSRRRSSSSRHRSRTKTRRWTRSETSLPLF
jgi:hypothetical protein